MKVAANSCRALASSASASSGGFATRSTLLTISTLRPATSASFARIAPVSSSRPRLASTISATRSASCAPVQAEVTMARSSRRRGAKMPGVSTNTSCALPSIAMPRTSVRVVCTLGLTIVTLVPTSALTRVDLPTLGAPISATKAQRVAPSAPGPAPPCGTGSAIARRRLGGLVHRRLDTLAHQERGGRGLLAGTLDLTVMRGRQAARLRPFLQHGLRVEQRPHRRAHAFAPVALDQRSGGCIAAIDEHRADQRLADVGEDGESPPAARIGLRGAELDHRPEVHRMGNLGAALATHQVGEPARQLALVRLGEGTKQHVGDDEAEDVVAEELQPLIAADAALARQRRDVGERAVEQRLLGKAVADPLFEFLASLPAAHRTIVNRRLQRTDHGQFQKCQAGSPSPTEKKMICARPIRFS